MIMKDIDTGTAFLIKLTPSRPATLGNKRSSCSDTRSALCRKRLEVIHMVCVSWRQLQRQAHPLDDLETSSPVAQLCKPCDKRHAEEEGYRLAFLNKQTNMGRYKNIM